MTDGFRGLLEEQGRTFHAVQSGIERLNDRCDSIETALGRSLRGSAEGEPSEERRQAETFASLITGKSAFSGQEDDEPDLETYRLYRGVLSKYLRYGLTHLTPDENQALVMGRVSAKALSVGIEADGGYWVTPQISDRVIQRQFDTSPIRTIANVVTIGTDAIEFPMDSNDLITGGWVGETGTRGETATPEVGIKRIPVHEQFANPRATQKVLDDAAFPVEQWLADRIADKFIREENAAFVTGNGVSKPRGFLDYGGDSTTENDDARAWGLLQYVPSGNGSGFAGTDPGDALIDLVHKLKAIYRARAIWVMNRATAAEVRKFKDGQGNYLWSGGNVQEGLQQRLLGFPVVEAEDMPDVGASAFPIAFGDFMAGYQIVDRESLSDILQGLEEDILRVLTRTLITEPLAAGIRGGLTDAFPESGGSGQGGLGGLVRSGLGGLFGLIGVAGAAGGGLIGGTVHGPGGPTGDRIPALLSDGEFVVNAEAARRHRRLLEMINAGITPPAFATGGRVAPFLRFVGADVSPPRQAAAPEPRREPSFAGRPVVVHIHNPSSVPEIQRGMAQIRGSLREMLARAERRGNEGLKCSHLTPVL